MTTIEQTIDTAIPRRGRSLYVLTQLFRRRTAFAGLIIIAIMVIMAVFAPLVAPYDPLQQDIPAAFQMPTLSHPLGTDELGRDLLSRIIYGSRSSLEIGILAIGIGGAMGVVIGMVSGYFRGIIDSIFMRLIETLLALPGLLLVIALATSLGTGMKALIIAVAVGSVPHFARLIRGSVLLTRELDYVQAARVIGAGDIRIMAQHIWPNCLQPIIVQGTLGVGVAILVSTGASFIGVGVHAPTPDWGLMISSGHQYVFNNWWLSVPPGVAIMLAVMGFNLLGDGLRDALDPRLRGAS